MYVSDNTMHSFGSRPKNPLQLSMSPYKIIRNGAWRWAHAVTMYCKDDLCVKTTARDPNHTNMKHNITSMQMTPNLCLNWWGGRPLRAPPLKETGDSRHSEHQLRFVFATSTQRPEEDYHEPFVRIGKNTKVAPSLLLTDW